MTNEIDEKSVKFRERLLMLVSAGFGGAALLVGGVQVAAQHLTITTMGAGITVCLCALALYLRRRFSYLLAAKVLIYGVSLAIASSIVLDPAAQMERGLLGLGLMVVVAGLLLGSKLCKVLGSFNILLMALIFGIDIVRPEITIEVILRDTAALCFFPVVLVIIVPTVEYTTEHIGKLRRRLLHVEDFAAELNKATRQLKEAELQISVMSQQQRQGAIRQSAAIKEVSKAMCSMSSSSHQIAQSAQSVVINADKAFSNSEQVGERVEYLTSHLQRITAALQNVSSIARKSEMLALNASLEGTRAGAAGRGFSLVASQMQRLAENVMTSVGEIKGLTRDVHQATGSTEQSTKEATSLARSTAEAAHQIRVISQHQQTATDHVTRAMEDIDEITSQVEDGNKQIWASTEDLGDLAYHLNQLVAKLVLKAP